MKRLLLVVLLLGGWFSIQAQKVAGLKEAVAALNTIRDNGKTAPYGFDIKYIYSNESRPASILDSLTGKIEIAGSNFYCLMDSTESIHIGMHNITLFQEDKLMLIGVVNPDSLPEPVAYVQAMITKSGAQSCTITSNGRVKTINISFKEGSPCKQMKLQIDTVANHMLSVDYSLKTILLVDPAAQAENKIPEGYDEYALVRTTFFNYHMLKQPEARFKEDQYFFKEGTEYKPAAAYSDFQVVQSTPNL